MNDQEGHKPLHWSDKQYTDVVVALLEDVSKHDERGWSELHIAVHIGNNDLVVTSLERGAYVDARTGEGETSLHFAAKSGHTDIAVVLLEKGADIDARTSVGCTEMQLVAEGGNKALVFKLLE